MTSTKLKIPGKKLLGFAKTTHWYRFKLYRKLAGPSFRAPRPPPFPNIVRVEMVEFAAVSKPIRIDIAGSKTPVQI